MPKDKAVHSGTLPECNACQIEMIDHYMSGWTMERSFATAFPDEPNPSRNKASREFAKPEVQAEIKRQREQLCHTATQKLSDLQKLWTREDAIRTYTDLITESNKRRAYADNPRDYAALSKVINDSSAALSKILGYDAPVKVESDSTITVKFGSDTDNTATGDDDWTG